MASMLSTQRAHLDLFLQTMVAEGLISNEFLQLQNLRESRGRDFIVPSIISYWRAARNLFTEMSQHLEENAVEFYDVLGCAHDMLERSNSIGAMNVSIACTDIYNGCQESDKDRCTSGLTRAKREFARLQVKLESVVELERKIIECEDIWRATAN